MSGTARLYGDTPFKRHFSYFDYNNTGIITPYQSLRASLSLGINFPASCIYAVGLQLVYGNIGFLGLGGVNVELIPASKERTQLQDVSTGKTPAGTEPRGYDRAGIMSLVRGKGFMNRMHALGFWAMAANQDGVVSNRDVQLFQRGELLPELQRRRANSRDDVLPFLRGGPGQ